jgi:hypothetical protein
LPDERARRFVIDGPHRMAELTFHRLALRDGALGQLHRRGWSRREEPGDLGVTDHREPRAGVAGLEGADDQAWCLEPGAHDKIIEAAPSRAPTATHKTDVNLPYKREGQMLTNGQAH